MLRCAVHLQVPLTFCALFLLCLHVIAAICDRWHTKQQEPAFNKVLYRCSWIARTLLRENKREWKSFMRQPEVRLQPHTAREGDAWFCSHVCSLVPISMETVPCQCRNIYLCTDPDCLHEVLGQCHAELWQQTDEMKTLQRSQMLADVACQRQKQLEEHLQRAAAQRASDSAFLAEQEHQRQVG